MKKTYQTPTITIDKVETTLIIAASTPMYGENATGEAMGRQGYFYGEEEEEYE